jgi:hypothetical protein
MGETSRESTKSHLNVPNLKNISTCQTSSFRTFCQKKRSEGSKAKGDTKEPNATRGATKLSKRNEPKK